MPKAKTTEVVDWEVIGRDVIPWSDLMAHCLGDACWCRPTYDEGIMIHHSMDRREEYERGRKVS